MDSTKVIKVKYGETLRRFTAHVHENELDIDMGQLREKVRSLFDFAPDAVLTFTYIDEDGDAVTLVDEEDLRDVMRQSLNPLRITVKLNAEKGASCNSRSSSSSTPMMRSQVQHPFTNLDTSLAEIFKSVPEPFHGTFLKLTSDLSSKAVQSATGLPEVLEGLVKMGQSYLNSSCPSKTTTESKACDGATGSTVGASKIEDLKAPNDDRATSEVHSVLKPGEPISKISDSADLKNETIGLSTPVTAAPSSVNLNINVSDDHALSKSISEKSVPCPLNGKTVVHSASVNLKPFATPGPGNVKVEKKSGDCSPVGMSAGVGGPSNFEDSIRQSILDSQTADFYSGFGKQYSSDYWKSYVSRAGLNPLPKCPFTGMPIVNDSTAAPQLASRLHPFKRSYSHSDGTRGIFHRGVRCDGCGIHPIVGPRFKSKVKENYDLCDICFTEKGNVSDYIRIERPVSYGHPWSFKGLSDHQNNVLPSKQHVMFTGCGMKSKGPKPDARFIQDINIPDGTVMVPSTPFTKIWRMRNNGNVVWPHGAKLVWIGGDKLSDTVAVNVEIALDGFPVDNEIDIAVDFVAPEYPGRYISYWRMASPSGQKFGQRVWVLIQVDATLRDSLCGNLHGLNLNLPPESNDMTGSEIINVTVDPMVDNSLVEPDYSPLATQSVRPTVEHYPNKDLELNFPINDTLLVGNGVPTPFPWKASSPVKLPVVCLSEVEATALATTPGPISNVTTSTLRVGETEDVEESLLRELAEMGFKQVELNKEVLRLNRYNLEQSVDDLCGVAEWDPILEELQEMGFCDEELNKKLLKKNNGSIKRVVMDLLAGK